MPIIIDFNGYIHGENEFIVKEYSLLRVNKQGKVESNEVGVLEALCEWDELDEVTQQNYQQFYSKSGIDWTTGTEDLEFITEDIIDILSNEKIVYLRDNKQKEMLINFLGAELNNDFISLVDDLEYDELLKMSTHCINHDNHSQNNCAIDNTYAMYDWLKRTKKYRKSDPKSEEVKKHVVVDFVGYFVPVNRFVIKEFNAFVIDDTENIFSNKHDKYFITDKPNFLNFRTLPFDYQVLYESFYETFGISWNTGDYKFRYYTKALRKYFDKAVNIYVRNNGNKKLLLDIIGWEHRNKIVVLQKFGYREQPKMRTLCPNHDKAWKNNCAIDNSRSMVRWIIRNSDKFNIVDVQNEH